MGNLASSWPIERAAPEAVGMCPDRLQRISDLSARYVDEGKIAGVITLVTRRGKIAHLECVGQADLEAARPMTEDAIFRIYSMTKLVTSVATLMLLEEGRFLLGDPVYKFIPEFEGLRVKETGDDGKVHLVKPHRHVTIHDLLTHLGGLSYDVVHEARESGRTLAEFIPEFCTRPLISQPGQRWNYSASTDVLGRLIEVISGQPFDEFLEERIFAPLGMTDTAFWVPPEKVDRLAEVYQPDESGKLVPAEDLGARLFRSKPSLPSGGGGLVATTSDYLRFSLTLLGGGELDGVRLLGPKTVDLMTSDHLPPGHGPVEVNNRGFGLGVSVLRHLGETHQIGSVGEFGWGGAACTQAWIDPAEDVVTMLMLQLRPGTGLIGVFPLMDQFKNAAYQAIVD